MKKRQAPGAGPMLQGVPKSSPTQPEQIADTVVNRLFIAVGAFMAGSGLMILEMAGNRVLAPWFGNSLYTWTGLIGVVLVSISVGNGIGGYLADRFSRCLTLPHLFAMSGVAVMAIPFVQAHLNTGFDNFDIVWGPVVASLALFTFPGIIMGAISPVAVRLMSSLYQDKRIGLSSGRIGMLGTIGSVCGTFAGGFWLIPLVPLNALFLALGAGLCLYSAVGYFLFIRQKGRAAALAALLLLAPVPALIAMANPDPLPPGFLHDEMSFYHRIRVYDSIDRSGGIIRTMLLDSTDEGAQIVGSKKLPLEYQRYWELVRLLAPPVKSAAFLGGGAFGMPEALSDAFPAAEVSVAELDPRVVLVGQDFFRLSDYPRVKVVAEDARRFLKQSHHSYDLIFGDAYNGVRYVPGHLLTREFFSLARDRLSANGIFMMNIISAVEGRNSQLYASVGITLGAVFPHVYVFATTPRAGQQTQNIILLGSLKPMSILDGIRSAALDKETGRMFAESYRGEFSLRGDAGMILTDQHNPAEYMVARSRLNDEGPER